MGFCLINTAFSAQIDLLILQPGRHLASGDALGDALRDGGLADTGFADEAGVVLLAAAQDLDGAVDLTVAADRKSVV